MTLRFKTIGLEDQLMRAHPLLRTVLEDLDMIWPGDPRIASIERKPGQAGTMGAQSPHVTMAADGVTPRSRAADISVLGLPWGAVERVAADLNRRWEYDRTRPLKKIAVPETPATNPGATAPHLHVQVHDSTRRRPEKIETA